MPVDTVFRTAEEIVSYLEELNSDVFVACLDTGHANINGISAAHMVKVLNQHLKVLHVHDNYAALISTCCVDKLSLTGMHFTVTS